MDYDYFAPLMLYKVQSGTQVSYLKKNKILKWQCLMCKVEKFYRNRR